MFKVSAVLTTDRRSFASSVIRMRAKLEITKTSQHPLHSPRDVVQLANILQLIIPNLKHLSGNDMIRNV